MKLSIIQIIAGALICTASSFILTWGYQTEFIIWGSDGNDILQHVFINPGSNIIRAQVITGLIFILGLAVLSVGIAQFIKARKYSIKQ